MAYAYDNSNLKELGIRTGGVASFMLAGKLVAVAIGVIALIVVARLLGPAQYGGYTLAVGISGVFIAFGGLGIGQYLGKNLPALIIKGDMAEVGAIIGSSLVLLIVIGLLLTAVGYALSGTIIHYMFNNNAGTGIIIAALSNVLVSILMGNSLSALIGLGEEEKAAITGVVSTAVQAAVSILAVLYGFGAEGAVFGITIGLLFGSVYAITQILHKVRLNISFAEVRNRARAMLGFSMPLTLSATMASFASNLSIVFLAAFVTSSAMGCFGIANKVGNFIDVITGSLGVAILPMFASAYSKKSTRNSVGKLYEYSIYFGVLFTAPVIVYLAVFSQPIITFLFSSAYSNAPFYIAIVGIGILASIVGMYGPTLATIMGDVKRVLYYASISVAAQLISMAVLVPAYGALGLIVSLFFVNGIVLDILYMRYVRTELGFRINYNMARILMANVVLALIFMGMTAFQFANGAEIFLGGVILLIAYPALIGALGAVDRERLSIMSQVGSRIPVIGFLVKAISDYSGYFARG